MNFELLYKKFSPTIKRIAYKLNGHYRSFNHDDLYQEATIHLWDSFLKGSIDGKTDSYILQGCYFHLKNYIRKVNERSGIISIDSTLEGDDQVTIEELLGEQWSCPDCRQELHNKFLVKSIQDNGFTKREKNLLNYFSQGLNTREIGKRMGVSHVSVIKMAQKVRIKAKRYLDK